MNNVLISSTLNRAREAAEIIAPALNLSVVLNDKVQELNIGDLEGLKKSSFINRAAGNGWHQ
jgi:broad specificity phosphatase PhoE